MESGKIECVEDMPVYQLFYRLALDVERLSREYDRDFRWLRNQSLRSSESVCSNMTEGFYAQYSTEYLQSLFRCRREARETMTHAKYARDVRQLAAFQAQDLLTRYADACRQLSSLIASIERKIRDRGKSKPDRPGCVQEETALYETNHQPLTINHGKGGLPWH